MSSDAHRGGATGHHPLDDVPTEHYELLRDPRRVRLLEVLEERSEAGATPSPTELAAALLERETDESDESDEPVDERRRDLRISLVHDHLPRLADHGIVGWDRDRNAVDLHEETPLPSASLSALVETAEDEAAVLERVTDPIRLRLVDDLADSSQPLSVEQLAATLVSQDGTVGMDRAKIALHHSHLPALEEAGVLEYDLESGLVSLADDVPTLFG
ncbi:hypothetical protein CHINAEXTREME_01895 [Halobiforma lacisalsi AJ5]|uniref:DUF7344 domain-containing protein n=1 Tax=Natronobacterium lacisalsi AJ5 TaxID=358396 RepID=M0LEZ3_NATLA|nr:hypothetical protein [Halobiforma lacisalsi]APW96597.1 hypothetical protein CHINAEXTREME_01895 [Halobiforma lacisalsi AJ5]EMA32121.1 hypothetical protein C445_12441 [Halobiforma lacisalsi AJ5]